MITSSASELPIINGYTPLRYLAAGGMATVYSSSIAHGYNAGRPVVIKLLNESLCRDTDVVTLFMRESLMIQSFQHSNIVEVIDVGQTVTRQPYMVMEYLEGGSLKDRIQSGVMEPHQALTIIYQIANALSYLHERDDKVIHRDLSPANVVFRDDSTPVLIDFGIAKKITITSHLTLSGQVAGTPLYMSPERHFGEPYDERSDLYSLGVIFYELLTGKHPYKEQMRAEQMRANRLSKSLFRAIPKLSNNFTHASSATGTESLFSLNAHTLPKLQLMLNKLLAYDPKKRYQSVHDLNRAIDEYFEASHQPNTVFGLFRNGSPLKWCNKKRGDKIDLLTVSMVLICFVGVFSIFFFSMKQYQNSEYFQKHYFQSDTSESVNQTSFGDVPCTDVDMKAVSCYNLLSVESTPATIFSIDSDQRIKRVFPTNCVIRENMTKGNRYLYRSKQGGLSDLFSASRSNLTGSKAGVQRSELTFYRIETLTEKTAYWLSEQLENIPSICHQGYQARQMKISTQAFTKKINQLNVLTKGEIHLATWVTSL